MVKKHDGATYLFAAGMRGNKTTATFTFQQPGSYKTIEVIGENRTIAVKNGIFKDNFESWDVHLYRTK